MSEIDNWGEPTDTSPPPPAQADRDALILELVSALVHMLIQPAPDTDYARRIIAMAKGQGYEP